MSLELSTFEVKPSSINKEIKVPSSKSYANRLLILAAIDKDPVVIRNIPLSSDVIKMVECLKIIGLDIKVKDDSIEVKNSFPECEQVKSEAVCLETGDGGTTNRFILPLLARGKNRYILRPEGHMRVRPMSPLVDALKQLGCELEYSVDPSQEWIKVKGPIHVKKEVEVDCSESTQFITGLSLATVDKEITVKPYRLEVSLPYWRLTLHLLESYRKKELDYINPVDFSSLTYPLALAAVNGKVLVKNAKEVDIYQADSKFIQCLKDMGAEISFGPEGLFCKSRGLAAIEFDGSQCPDAIPTLLYLCSFAKGKSRIYNLEVLTHKECDRFSEMIRILEAFGVSFEVNYNDFEIMIVGKSAKSHFVEFTPEKDHRMVMVSYLFMRSLAGGILHNSEHVKKSFANFFEVMSSPNELS
ncbi:MAG: hypothetical protein CME60_03070 [Halobacteriovoraceae bacterium]|nr:hypothetical protein [Halobacteriovoraceae bacterium]